MLKKPYSVTNCQKKGSNMLCSLMCPVVLWESIGDWKAALWRPTRQVAETAEGRGEPFQFAEVKSIQLPFRHC